MERNVVGWFEIYVENMERAVKFYETMLGITMVDMPLPESGPPVQMKFFPMVDDMNGAGAPGALAKMEGVKAGTGGTLVYFSSEDCSVEEARVAEAGGKVMQSKFPIGDYGFISVVVDTEGNTIGIHSMQ